MHTDITRSTFRREKHYTSVRWQQGRVQLDAEANEQADIGNYQDETARRDLIGLCGGPLGGAGFGLQVVGGQLQIGDGRYYVDGILCENEQTVPITGQPDLPGYALPNASGVFLAYVDVWTRHMTALEDPSIREVALGGPDTATRAKTVWQVRLLRAGNLGALINCLSDVPAWNALTAPSSALLSARAQPTTPSDEPCVIPPGAGFRGLSNHLYRVEVHSPGAVGAATFKWSRDNGSVTTRVTAISGDEITLASAGRDAYLSYAPGQWLEVTDDWHALAAEPGVLVQVARVDGPVLTVDLATATGSLTGADFPLDRNPVARRWDSNGLTTVSVPAGNDGFLPVEEGVEVRFEAGDYKAGDYWLIPARTLTASVEWPADASGQPVPQPRNGIEHHYCRLAVVAIDAGGNPSVLSDCRDLFPPVTQLTSMVYVAGDGQEVLYDPTQPQAFLPLPQALQVGVANGQWPVQGATVRFTVTGGAGRLQGAGAMAEVTTGGDGIASCAWELGVADPVQKVEATLLDAAGGPVHIPVRFTATVLQLTSLFYLGGDGQSATPDFGDPSRRVALAEPLQVGVAQGTAPVAGATVRFRVTRGSGRLQGAGATADVVTGAGGVASCAWELDSTTLDQQVQATLLDASLAGIHLPVTFGATLSVASRVAYDPQACPALAAAGTVQEAIDLLCQVAEEPGIRIERVSTRGPDGSERDLVNDAPLPVNVLAAGLRIRCSRPVNPRMAEHATCFVTLEMPFPFNFSDQELWGGDVVGFQPLVLAGEVRVEDAVIQWRPVRATEDWLVARLFQRMAELGRGAAVLARLTLKGNFISQAGDQDVYVDGDTFGVPREVRGVTITDVRWPTGDGRRGGDLEMWFRLIPPPRRIGLIPGRVSVVVTRPPVLLALNLAIDRARLREFLPAGYETEVTLPLDRARARRLVRRAGARDTAITVLTPPDLAGLAETLTGMYRQNAGLDLEVVTTDDITSAVRERRAAGLPVDMVLGDETLAAGLASAFPDQFTGDILVF